MTEASVVTMGTFLYFGYGSNLLRQRLQLNNPSAKFVTTAVLKDHKLTFRSFNRDPLKTRWYGAGATIIEAHGESVWGCLWEIGNEHKDSLDKQELLYIPKNVTVAGSDDKEYTCRTYQSKMVDESYDRPSSFYMDVIIKGANQNGICEDYVKFLESIETNGVSDIPKVYQDTMKMLTSV